MKNKVSIIVPVYNGEKYIKECVESLQNQNYKNIEIIVVNDGSSDNTEKIVNRIVSSDNRVILINQQNLGVSAARNNGIKQSSGKYLTFVDSDDKVSKEYINYLVSLIEDNNCDISLTRTAIKFNKTTKNFNDDVEDTIEIFDGVGAANEMLLYKIIISSWNKMFKRDLLIKNDIFFNKKLSFGEGFEFVINAFLHSKKVAIGNKKYYFYRVDNINSVMTKFSRKLVTGSIDSQNSIKQMVEKIDSTSNKMKLLNSCKYSMWHTNCDCLNTIVGSNSTNKNLDLYKMTYRECRKNALNSFKCDIAIKDKIKSILYFISPYATAKIINKFRIRRYTEEQKNES